MDRKWHEIALAPANEVVETKIDDGNGDRNHALLIRQGRMWFFPYKSMYVYYAPTHFRWPTPEQLEEFARGFDAKAAESMRQAAAFRASLTSHKRPEVE